jgi:predicted NBD/HSP70 family sugar kinase
MAPYRWGVDWGGTKIEVGVFDPSFEVVVRRRMETRADLGYESILMRFGRFLEEVSGLVGSSVPDVIGIGTPGSIDPRTGRMRNSNTVCLNGQRLREDLAEVTGREIAIANDADCFALAEARIGVGRDLPTVFGVILGTGVGGGIVHHGELLSGPNRIAGEWGHNLHPLGTDLCYCGRTGCIETVISGPALERRHTGGVSLAEWAADQDVRVIAKEVAMALGPVFNLIDPDLVVLGGGVSNLSGLAGLVADETRAFVFHEDPRVRIEKASLGDSAGVFGAAMLT